MLKHLIIKEIREIFTNTRSLFVLLICFMLIPLGMYVSTKEYEQNRNAYRNAERMYTERSKNEKSLGFIAEGYIPPSPLSIFSSGLKGYLPDKITADSRGIWQAANEYGINNPVALLFGKIDFYFIITNILSLLAFIFTFNSISGEKESGTLKLLAAHSVPRWNIILAKIIGNYIIFLVSFLVGTLSGLVLLTLSSDVPILSGSYLAPFIIILIISLLLLFILFNMGILLSIKTRNSSASITAALFVWILIAIIIPKISPMIAQVIYPIETEELVNKKKTVKREEIQAEFDKARGELMTLIMKENGLNSSEINMWTEWDNPSFKVSRDDYDLKIIEVKKKFDDRVSEDIKKIEKDYANKKTVQQNIARNISRISPVSCYTYLINDITHTGLGELRNIESNAIQFAQHAELEYYSHFRKNYKEYRIGGNYTSGYHGDMSKVNVTLPSLQNYRYPALSVALVNNWIDLILICFYAFLFFTLSVFQFIKYDVR